MRLVDQIEHDAVNGRPVAETLRKVLVLGGRAGSTTLRRWATQELKGYGPDDELPEYRRVTAPLLVDALVSGGRIRGQRVSVHELPEFARSILDEKVEMWQPVGEIEAIIRNLEASGESTAHLAPPGSADLVLLWNHESDEPFQHIQSLYWSVSVSALHGVVDQVRTVLTELVAEIRAGMLAGDETPTSEVVDQAVSVAIHGNNARVTITHQTAGRDATAPLITEKASGWWERWWRLGAFIVGTATVISAVIAVIVWRSSYQ